MRTLRYCGIVPVIFVALTSAIALANQPYTEEVNFGDSLTDVGNVFALTGGTKPDPTMYWNGRASNGLVWSEVLASKLGIPIPTPGLLGGPNGTNFACYGALAYGGVDVIPPTLSTQVGIRLSMNKPIRSTDLFTLWGGANDVFNDIYAFGKPTSDPSIPANAIKSQISLLAGAGAKEFLVMNLPPLGLTPWVRGTPLQDPMNTWAAGFNASLKASIDDLKATLPADVQIHELDVYDLFGKIFADPEKYGLKDVSSSAVMFPAANPDDYLFWDTVHPTRIGHQLIAEAAYSILVPEPTCLGMLTIAAACVLLRRRAA
ncbi:MAG: SGNH/GDSL hydrolase family protein [Bacillota bacterium]